MVWKMERRIEMKNMKIRKSFQCYLININNFLIIQISKIIKIMAVNSL